MLTLSSCTLFILFLTWLHLGLSNRQNRRCQIWTLILIPNIYWMDLSAKSNGLWMWRFIWYIFIVVLTKSNWLWMWWFVCVSVKTGGGENLARQNIINCLSELLLLVLNVVSINQLALHIYTNLWSIYFYCDLVFVCVVDIKNIDENTLPVII